MVATVAAIGTLLGGLGAVAGPLMRNNSGQQGQSFALEQQAQRDAESNDAFQRALAVLINQRSVAGSQDSFGSTLRYDPATNQWVSNLGPLPKAEQTAASQADVTRNTTDLGQTELANTNAMRRAALASPVYDTSIRNLQNFKPQSADELTGLLTQQGVTANNTVMRPLIADTLRQFGRAGTSAAPVLDKLGQTSYNNLKDALVSGRIQALSSTADLNNKRQQGLESAATTTAGLSNPNLQFSGIQASGQNALMANLLADRAKSASTAPAYGASGVNTGQGLNQAALKNLAGSVPNPNADLNAGLNSLGSLGSLLQNKEAIGNIASLFGGPTPDKTLFQGFAPSLSPGQQGVGGFIAPTKGSFG